MNPQVVNPAMMAMLFRKEFQLCNVQKGETIALLTDLAARRDYVAAAFAAGKDLGADVYEMCVNSVPTWTKVGVETVGKCKGTLEALKHADMLVCMHVPLFTKWLKEVTIYAGERLKRARKMRVTSDAGTDLTVQLGEYPTMIQYGFAEAPRRFD